MGKIRWIGVLVVCLLSFGSVSVASNLDTLQQKQVAALEGVEEKLLPLYGKLKNKQTDHAIREQLDETQEEVEELLAVQQEAILDAKSVEEVREIMEETKDRIVLKTFDGITSRASLDEIVQVEGGSREQEKAVDAVLEVIGKQTTRSLQIVTPKTKEEVANYFKTFDSEVVVEELFQDNGNFYLQVTFTENSILKEELFTELDEGVLPEYFLGYKIVKPEVYTIGQLSLSGEYTAALRGQTRWNTFSYHESLRDLPKVHVGVVDTGIDPIHPDLINVISKTIPGYDFVNNDPDPFDDHMHGTHVAGTIGAQVNGMGVYGVNPAVELVPLKICTKTGYCPSYAITNALIYAADHGIEVLNMSLGGPGTLLNNPTCAAIEYATTKGTIAVVAAGNANTSATTFIPAACPHTITVGAVNKNLQRATFSNYGPHVDISAPGVDIYSTIPGGGRKSLDGTSMATPHVSAAVAAVLAKEGAMGTEIMKQRLLSFTSPVGFESEKQIGPFLEYASLMESLGIRTCGGTGCLSINNETGTGAYGSGEDVLIQNKSGLYVDINVGESVYVLTGSQGSTLEPGSGGVLGFGNIKGGVIQGGGVRVLGLRAGYSSFFVRNSLGDKHQVVVHVHEKTIRIKPGERVLLGGNNEWRQTKSVVASSLASTRLYYNSSRYVSAGGQEGYSTVTNRIYNKAEQKEQDIVYTLRIGWTLAVEPLTVTLDQSSLKVGQVGEIRIKGGTPKYTIKKSNQNVAFAQVGGAGALQIASAQTLPEEDVILVEESGDVYTSPLFSGEEDGLESSLDDVVLIDTELPNEVEVAASQDRFSIYVIGLAPGDVTITIVDYEGTEQTITFPVEETVLTGPLGTQKGWYYQYPYKFFEVQGLVSAHPAIVPTKYSSRTYIYTLLRDGITSLTLQLWNPFESKRQQMHYTVRSGNPSTLQVAVDSGVVAVGETTRITITGGGGPYTISKNNENIGLGYALSDMTTILSVPEKYKIVFPQGTVSTATVVGELGLGTGEIDLVTSGWTDEEFKLFDGLDPAGGVMSVSSLPSGLNSQRFRVVGLTPGTTTLTVKDVYGEVKTVTITTTPKQISLTSVYLGGTFRAPYNPRHFVWFMNNQPLSSTSSTWWSIENIRPTTPNIVKTLSRGSFSSYYLYGLASGSTSLEVDIYNPHERKQQKMMFSVTTSGMSALDIEELLADYVIKNKSDGPVSSINPGGGGFVDEDGSSSLNSPIIDIISQQDTILGKIVQIQISGGSQTYELILDKDVQFIDAPMLIAYVESGSNEEGELIQEYVSEAESGVDISSVTITQTYTVPVVADRTYSLIIRNASSISVKDIQKNTQATKNLSTNTTYSTFTYTAVKGSTLDLSIHPSYLFSSANNSIMTIIKKTGGGYRLSFPSLGSTKLKVTYTNPITGATTVVMIDVKVLEKGSINQGPEVIEKTIYVKPGGKYVINLPEGNNYSIGYSNLLMFDSISLVASESSQFDGAMRRITGIYDRIRLGDGIVFTVPESKGAYVIRIILSNTEVILNVVVSTEHVSLQHENIAMIKIIEYYNNQLKNIEDYIVDLFFSSRNKILNDSSWPQRLTEFKEKFGDAGEWNIKLYLQSLGYVSEDAVNIPLYNMNLYTSDIGNLLYGYLAGLGGFYDLAIKAGYIVELNKYIKYYGLELGNKRAIEDEAPDKIWYREGMNLAILGVEGKRDEFILELMRSMQLASLESNRLKYLEEQGLRSICNDSKGIVVECFSSACQELDSSYYIISKDTGNIVNSQNCF